MQPLSSNTGSSVPCLQYILVALCMAQEKLKPIIYNKRQQYELFMNTMRWLFSSFTLNCIKYRFACF